MPKKKSKYKDPPKYNFIITYEDKFKENFADTLDDVKKLLEDKLKEFADES